jgi:iron complex transport system substrate-binding protein
MIRALSFLLLLPAFAAAEPVRITDSRGPQTVPAPPGRVVALSWSLAEQVLALGVEPVAIADPEGYRRWVARPELPQGVVGVGLRQEPNHERIAELEPDVILASDEQIAFADALSRIAPVVHFDAFSPDHDNAAAADRIFREVAALLGRADRAEAALAARDRRISALRDRLAERFGETPPPVTVIRLIDTARVAVYGANSTPVAALRALGLESGVSLPPSTWGLTMQRIAELGRIEEGHVLHIRPFPGEEALFARPLWQAMPFVRAGRFHALPPVWTYGGAMSIGYLAEEIAAALLAADPA